MIAIIDYDAGNIKSVEKAMQLLGQEVKFAADPEVVGPNAKAAVEAMQDGDVVEFLYYMGGGAR